MAEQEQQQTETRTTTMATATPAITADDGETMSVGKRKTASSYNKNDEIVAADDDSTESLSASSSSSSSNTTASSRSASCCCNSDHDHEEEESYTPQEIVEPAATTRATAPAPAPFGGLYDDDSLTSHREIDEEIIIQEQEQGHNHHNYRLKMPRHRLSATSYTSGASSNRWDANHSDHTWKLDNTGREIHHEGGSGSGNGDMGCSAASSADDYASQESWFCDLDHELEQFERECELNSLNEEEDSSENDDEESDTEESSMQLSIATKLSEITMEHEGWLSKASQLFEDASITKPKTNLYNDDEEEEDDDELDNDDNHQQDQDREESRAPAERQDHVDDDDVDDIAPLSPQKATTNNNSSSSNNKLNIQQEIQWRQTRLHELQQEQAKLLREVQELQLLQFSNNSTSPRSVLDTPPTAPKKTIDPRAADTMMRHKNNGQEQDEAESPATPRISNYFCPSKASNQETASPTGKESATSQLSPFASSSPNRQQRTARRRQRSHLSPAPRSESFLSHESDAAVVISLTSDDDGEEPRAGSRKLTTRVSPLTSSGTSPTRKGRSKLMRRSEVALDTPLYKDDDQDDDDDDKEETEKHRRSSNNELDTTPIQENRKRHVARRTSGGIPKSILASPQRSSLRKMLSVDNKVDA